MSRSEATPSDKEALREEFLARRDDLSSDRARRSSERICRHLDESDVLASVDTVAGYMARGGEADLLAYLDGALRRGVQVLLPRVTGPGEMEFCPIEGWNQLEPGSFGIDEPVGPATSIEHVDVFLVPGVAFDHRGNRLGFGGGYYDRALPPRNRAVAVGVGHHWQFVDALPAESHDRPMDHVVTDRGWHRISQDQDRSRE